MSQLQSFEVLLFAHFQEIGEACMEHLKSTHANNHYIVAMLLLYIVSEKPLQLLNDNK